MDKDLAKITDLLSESTYKLLILHELIKLRNKVDVLEKELSKKISVEELSILLADPPTNCNH